MARTTLATQALTDEGLEATYTAANADGHFFDGTGDVILHVINGSGADVDVTIQTPATQDGLAIADQVVTVTAGEERFIGPFPPRTYTRESGSDIGKVYVDFESVTSVTIAALQT